MSKATNLDKIKDLNKANSLLLHCCFCLLFILVSPALKAENEYTNIQMIQVDMQRQPELTEVFNNPQAYLSDRKNRQLQKLAKAARPILIQTLKSAQIDSATLVMALKISTALRLQNKEFIDVYVNLLKHPERIVAELATRTISKLLPDDLMLLRKVNNLKDGISYPLAKYEILSSFALAGSAEAEALLIANPSLYLSKTTVVTDYPNHDIYKISPILVRWLEMQSQKRFLFRSQFEDISLIFKLIQQNKNDERLSYLLKLLMLKIAVHKDALTISDHLMITRALNSWSQSILRSFLARNKDLELEKTALLIIELANKSIISSDPSTNSLITDSKAEMIKNNRLVCQRIY